MSIYLQMKDHIQKFNQVFSVSMLLLQLINLVFFASIPENLTATTPNIFSEIEQKISTCSYISYSLLVWILASELHHDVKLHYF